MDYMSYCNQMMGPEMYTSPLMQYPAEKLEDMYPDVYKVVYPKVRDMCMRMDVPGNPDMYPYPTRTAVERMTDEIYSATVAEMGNSDQLYAARDNGERQVPAFGYGLGYTPYAYPPYGVSYGYGAAPLLRGLIGILLIRSLLGRRGFFYY